MLRGVHTWPTDEFTGGLGTMVRLGREVLATFMLKATAAELQRVEVRTLLHSGDMPAQQPFPDAATSSESPNHQNARPKGEVHEGFKVGFKGFAGFMKGFDLQGTSAEHVCQAAGPSALVLAVHGP